MEDNEDSRSETDRDDDSRNNEESVRYPIGHPYRWECPICDMEDETTVRDPIRALRIHIYESEGEGHGDYGTFPEEYPEDADLDEFITRFGELG